MGIKDFLKSIFKQEEKPEPINIEFSNLPDFIHKKEEENKTKNKDFLNSINFLTTRLVKDLTLKIKILEEIDLSEKKAEEKVKLIVIQNLNNYIIHLKKLTNQLKEITNNNPQLSINQINNIFLNFEKNSSLNYQKATFLVGKEIGDMNNIIAVFSKNFQLILKENENLISTYQTLSIVKKNLNELENQKKSKQDIINKVELLSKDINLSKTKINSLKQNIGEIKNSREYKDELNIKQTIEDKKKQLQSKIIELKQLIDFKSLTNICHSNEGEMNIIKEHKENFIETYKKDNEDILNLLNQTRLLKQEITEKAKQISFIKNLIKELEDNLSLTNQQSIISKQSEIEQINSEINSKSNQIIKENKKIEKINNNIKDIINKIRQELDKFNLKIILSNK